MAQMINRLLFFVSVAIVTALCLAPTSAAQSSPVHLLVSNGLKASMEDLQKTCEATVGHPLEIRYNSTSSVKKSIEAGESGYENDPLWQEPPADGNLGDGSG